MKKIYYVIIGVGLFFFIGWDYFILNNKGNIALDTTVLSVVIQGGILGGIYGIYRLFELRKSKTISK